MAGDVKLTKAYSSDAFSPVALLHGEVHCPTCKGSGLWATGMDDIPCHACKGTGIAPETRPALRSQP